MGRLDQSADAADWLGLPWTSWMLIDSVPAAVDVGVCRIRRPSETGRLLYIGQGKLTNRLMAHRAKATRPGHRQADHFAGPVEVSVAALPVESGRALLEIENDLLASHLLVTGTVPDAQFLG